MPKKYKDKIYAKSMKAQPFVFNKKVVDVFDEMVERSVPFYHEVQRMVIEILKTRVPSGAVIYDLGCSKGRTMEGLIKEFKNKKVKVIGVDNSKAMLSAAEKNLRRAGCMSYAKLKEGDLNNLSDLQSCSAGIMILTLQFVRPLQRETLLKNIYRHLKPGGLVIIVDKVLGDSQLTQRMFIDMYHSFKERNGYSKLEIAQKREALENVLIPFKVDENRQLLHRSGFSTVDVFFSWYNFAGFIAVKS